MVRCELVCIICHRKADPTHSSPSPQDFPPFTQRIFQHHLPTSPAAQTPGRQSKTTHCTPLCRAYRLRPSPPSSQQPNTSMPAPGVEAVSSREINGTGPLSRAKQRCVMFRRYLTENGGAPCHGGWLAGLESPGSRQGKSGRASSVGTRRWAYMYLGKAAQAKGSRRTHAPSPTDWLRAQDTAQCPADDGERAWRLVDAAPY
jgi:hypothetical protein